METTEWIWHKGEFIKWNDAQVHFLTHSLHYGGGAFEGIRAYETKRGPAIFRLQEHIDRLVYSSSKLKMELPYSIEELKQATIKLIQKNRLKHCYIRPLAYFGYGVMGLNPKDAPVDVSIACWPWGAYLPHEMIDVKVTSFIRIHPKSTYSDAKLCGHYINSMISVMELRGTKYHEAMLCNLEGEIAEGPGENFFLVKDNVLHTPPLGGILAGITRATILQMAADEGIRCVEKAMSVAEAQNGDEAFYTGTAAEVTPIRSIDDRIIGSGKIGPITMKLRNLYLSSVRGENDKYSKFLTYASE